MTIQQANLGRKKPKKFPLRLPQDLFDRIVELCKPSRLNSTVTNLMIQLLEKGVTEFEQKYKKKSKR